MIRRWAQVVPPERAQPGRVSGDPEPADLGQEASAVDEARSLADHEAWQRRLSAYLKTPEVKRDRRIWIVGSSAPRVSSNAPARSRRGHANAAASPASAASVATEPGTRRYSPNGFVAVVGQEAWSLRGIRPPENCSSARSAVRSRKIVGALELSLAAGRDGKTYAVCDLEGRRVVALSGQHLASRVGGEVELVYSQVDADGSLREARTSSAAVPHRAGVNPVG
jgi:hypothetical protein